MMNLDQALDIVEGLEELNEEIYKTATFEQLNELGPDIAFNAALGLATLITQQSIAFSLAAIAEVVCARPEPVRFTKEV